jgi:uncharacterized alkaline shock family protein YloU
MPVLNWLNRALVVLLLVVVLVAALALAIAPGFLAGQLQAIAGILVGGDRLQLLIVGLAAALVSLGLLYLELRVRRSGAIALAGESGASLATQTVVQRLRDDVEQLLDVVRARPTVSSRRGSVDVDLAVDTAPGVDVPTKAAEIRQVAAGTVERLGLKLGRLNVSLSQTGRPPTDSPPASPL